MVINMIGKDQISGMLNQIIDRVIKAKAEQQLQPGEIDSIITLYIGPDSEPYAAIGFINDENQILRFDRVQKITDFINSQLENL